MAQFSVNTTRLDPYKNFKFRLKWDGKYVAGISKAGALKRSTEVVEHRAGGDPSTSHKSPGRNKYEAITLERGLTQDLAFHDWAGSVWNFGSALGSEVSLASFRKDIYLEFYNEAGQLGHRLQNISLLGFRISSHAGFGRQRQRDRHRAHQAGKRRLGAGHQRDRATRTDLKHRQHLTCRRFPVPIYSTSGNVDSACIRWTGVCSLLERRFPKRPARAWPIGPWDAAIGLWLYCVVPVSGRASKRWTSCNRCGEKLEFEMDGNVWAEQQPPGEPGPSEPIVVKGHSFRLPTSRDLARAAGESDPGLAALRLLEACRVDAVGSLASSEEDLSEGDLNEIGERMAAADPLAETRLTLHCHECGHQWEETLDIVSFFWAEIEARAKRLLFEIHTLASAYGWTEKEVLALSEPRRALYLRMVQA